MKLSSDRPHLNSRPRLGKPWIRAISREVKRKDESELRIDY